MYLPKHLESCTYEMQSHAHSISFSRAGGDAFGGLFGDIGEPGVGAGGGVRSIASVSVPMYLGKRGRPADCVVLVEEAAKALAEQVHPQPSPLGLSATADTPRPSWDPLYDPPMQHHSVRHPFPPSSSLMLADP